MPNSLHKANFLQFIEQVNSFFESISNQEKIELFKEKAVVENPWFSKNQIDFSLKAILSEYFNLNQWEKFFKKFQGSIKNQKKIGLILPGNIPAVGIHDILMVLASGHLAKIKPSSQDKALIELFLSIAEASSLSGQFQKVDKISSVDAIIATGSDSSVKIFESYFKNLPRIIRGHRSSIALLTGNEDPHDFHELAKDIFTYYGLGCRNISNILIPKEYDVRSLFDVLTTYTTILENNKYVNNYQYQRTLHVFNGKKHYDLGNILAVEEPGYTDAPIGLINLIRYNSFEEAMDIIRNNQSSIQCIVNKNPDSSIANSFYFGKAQQPSLDDFADLINSYEFLLNI